MTVYVFGNPDLGKDALPIKIVQELRKNFPEMRFETRDPNEEWEDIPSELTVIDTVLGIDKVSVFEDLASFASSPRVSMHDFDALANLRYLQKLGKLGNLKVIGVPPTITPVEALNGVSSILRAIRP